MAAGTCLLAYLDGELQVLDSLFSALRGEQLMWLLFVEAILLQVYTVVYPFLKEPGPCAGATVAAKEATLEDTGDSC